MEQDEHGFRFTSWGEIITPEMSNHSISFNCLVCDFGNGWPEKMYPYVVGYMRETSFGSILVCECPKCFEKFWFHMDDRYARASAFRIKRWPKDQFPEGFIEMFEEDD